MRLLLVFAVRRRLEDRSRVDEESPCGQPEVQPLRAGRPGLLLRQVRPDHGRADVAPANQRVRTRAVPSQRPPNDLSCRPSGTFPQLLGFVCSGLYENIFNVPVGLSIALTHSITVHGEVYPRLSKVNSSGVGWSVTVEKSLLRHRFAFFAGNQRQTTVDQYTQSGSVPARPRRERLHRLQSLPGLEVQVTADASRPDTSSRGRSASCRRRIPDSIRPSRRCATMRAHGRLRPRARVPSLAATDRLGRAAGAEAPRCAHGRPPRLATALRVGRRGDALCVRFDARDDGPASSRRIGSATRRSGRRTSARSSSRRRRILRGATSRSR